MKKYFIVEGVYPSCVNLNNGCSIVSGRPINYIRELDLDGARKEVSLSISRVKQC